MSHLTQPLPGTVPDPLYPALIWLREALQFFFAKLADVYVAADMFWNWQQGNPRSSTAPDVMGACVRDNH